MLCHPDKCGKKLLFSSSTISQDEMFAVFKKAAGEGKKSEAEERSVGALMGAGESKRGGRGN